MDISSDGFRCLLSDLDGDELVVFLADLWECRGYETTVSGDCIDVLKLATGERKRIAVARRPLLRWKIPDERVDIVVAPRSTTATRRLAQTRSASFVGPATLRRMVRYAVETANKQRLFERHFGRSLGDPEPSDWRRRVTSIERRELTLTVVLIAVVLSATVLVGGAPQYIGVGDSTSRSDATPNGDEVVTELTTATPNPSSTTRRGAVSYPPGIDDDGLVDADQLGTAHARALGDTSYRLLIARQISAVSNETEVKEGYREITVNDTERFRTESGGNLSVSEGGFGSIPVEVYADGNEVYRRVGAGNDSVYLTGPSIRADRFRNRAQWFTSVYLSTDESDLSRTVVSGETLYYIAATGNPSQFDDTVNYTAVAVIKPDGFVRSLDVSYERINNGTKRRVEFQLRYEERGGVKVSQPAWYPDARNATR